MPRASTSRSYKSVPFRPTLPSPPPSKPSLPLPPPIIYAPPPTFGQSVKDGFAFGIGSSVARNVVDSISNKLGSAFQQAPGAPRPFTGETLPPNSTEALYKQCLAAKASQHCDKLSNTELQEWIQCMKESRFDDRACDPLLKG